MNVIDEKKIRNSDSKDSFIKIIIEPNSLSKFPMQIMYYKEKGYDNFILCYMNENAKYSFDKIAFRILPNIFDAIEKHNVKIGLGGFSRCIFEKYFLKEEYKYKYEDKFFFHNELGEVAEDFEQVLDCVDCKLNTSCPGMYKKYAKKYKEDIMPIYDNNDLRTYYNKVKTYLTIPEIQNKFNICLEDFYAEEGINSRKLYFRERISSGSDEIKEGFSYFITNSSYENDKIISFIAKLFDSNIENLKEYLQKSGYFNLNFEVLTDDVMRKKIELDVKDFDREKIERLFDLCNFTLNEKIEKIDSVKIEITQDSYEITEIGYNIENISNADVKMLFKTYGLEQKRMLLKYLNSMHKDIKNSKLKYKYEHSILVSTSFETTLRENTLKLRLLSVLFGIKLTHLFERKVLGMWFEIYEFQAEKYGFNQMPKMPKRYPEFEENTNRNNRY